MEELILEFKKHLIEELNLEDLNPEDIDNDAALFGEGLGLDSIDALEILLILERKYGIKLRNSADAKAIFKSVRTIAEYIRDNRQK